MALSDELISQFVKTTNDNVKETKKEVTLYGEVINAPDDGPIEVRFDGANDTTPVKTTVTCSKGDRVMILLKNHTATVTGNLTDHSAGKVYVKENGNLAVDMIVELTNGLENGTTIIDGGCIETDTLVLTGQIKFSDLADDTKQEINQTTDGKINGAKEEINQTTDGKINGVKEEINQVTDGKINGVKEEINGTMNTIKNDIDKNISDLSSGMSSLSSDVSGLSSDISSLSNDVSDLSSDITNLYNITGDLSTRELSYDDICDGLKDANTNETSYIGMTEAGIPILRSGLIYGGIIYAGSEQDGEYRYVQINSESGLCLFYGDSITPKASLNTNKDGSLIQLVLGVGSNNDSDTQGKLFIKKGVDSAGIYYYGNNNKLCGMTFNNDGTITLIGGSQGQMVPVFG